MMLDRGPYRSIEIARFLIFQYPHGRLPNRFLHKDPRMATRHKPTFREPVKEYVDSPLMTQRFRHEKTIWAETAAISACIGRPLI